MNTTIFWGIIGLLGAAMIAGIFTVMEKPAPIIIENTNIIDTEKLESNSPNNVLPPIQPIPLPEINDAGMTYNVTNSLLIKNKDNIQNKTLTFIEKINQESDFKKHLRDLLDEIFIDGGESSEFNNRLSTIIDLEQYSGLTIHEIKEIMDSIN